MNSGGHMLSFNRGIPIAIALNKDGEIQYTIHVTPDKKEPDLSVDNLLELIDDADLSDLRSKMKLGRIEIKMLKQALGVDDEKRENINLSEKLKRALEILKEIATDKLKKEVDFSNDNDIVKVIPLIGAREIPYERSICAIGPSESGKTTLLKEICKHDRRKRPVIVFSKIDDDASLKDLKKLRTTSDKKSRMIKIPLHTEDQLLDLPSNKDLEETICIFDDIDSFSPEIGDFLRVYRDSILESGRHDNITCMSTSHILFNNMKTKTMLNECEIICLFPGANKRASFMFLKERFGLGKQDANFIINKAMKSGRTLCLKLSSPNLLIHTGGVMLI